jgi:hypothetical protein
MKSNSSLKFAPALPSLCPTALQLRSNAAAQLDRCAFHGGHMASHTLTGSCRCGMIALEVSLASDPGTYNPRSCDCDFCRGHEAAYISDPKGSVVIRTGASKLRILRQGDELAEFLCCEDCEQLVGVRWRRFGCVNARVIRDATSFAAEVSASPKMLRAAEKVSRWEKLWFPEFVVTANEQQSPAGALERTAKCATLHLRDAASGHGAGLPQEDPSAHQA